MRTNNSMKEQMEFQASVKKNIEATTKRVAEILDESFPDYLNFTNGVFTISRGSSQVMIIVRQFIDSETMVECISNVVTGARISPDLMLFLLRKNAELHFGSFSLLFDGTITFSHSISGTNLDPNELKNSLNSVAYIADYYDDIIVDMSGGKRASDLVDDINKEFDLSAL
jgi:adenylate cyclase